MKTKKTKRIKRVRAYAEIGSHGGIFMFDLGPTARNYPTLLHVYRKKVAPYLIPVTIVYKA